MKGTKGELPVPLLCQGRGLGLGLGFHDVVVGEKIHTWWQISGSSCTDSSRGNFQTATKSNKTKVRKVNQLLKGPRVNQYE